MVLLVDQYLDLYDSYVAKYGRVALLMQVGGFFEVYSDAEGIRGNAKEVGRCLNFAVKLKADNKTLMAGCQVLAVDKYIPILLQAGYTVVCYEQEVGDKGLITRVPTRVISPGTDLNTPLTNNWLMTVFVEFYCSGNRNLISVGMAVMDRTVSDSIVVHEEHASPSDPDIAIDTLCAFMKQYPPTECLVVSEQPQRALSLVSKLTDTQAIFHTLLWDASTIAGKVSEMSTHTLVAYTQLQSFLSDHFVSIQNPSVTYYQNEKCLDLSSTAVQQLDIPLLLRTIDCTKTVMGKRILRQRLVQPMREPAVVQSELDKVDEFKLEDVVFVRSKLEGVPDMQRYHQRIRLTKLLPTHFFQCHQVYTKVVDELAPIFQFGSLTELTKTIGWYESIIDIAECAVDDSLSRPLFKRGFDEELDRLCDSLDASQQQLDGLKWMLEREFDKQVSVKLNVAHFGFETTIKRAAVLKKSLDTLEYIKLKSSVIVTSKAIRSCIQTVQSGTVNIEKQQTLLFSQFQKDLIRSHGDILKDVEEYLAHLDFYTSAKWMANQFRYVKPQLVESEQSRQLVGTKLRHPVIERIHQQCEYIPTDIGLGIERQGIVLYGMNAGGKTSILKAVGLAVIMAQAGLFVAAKDFTFMPFNRIMTRIAGSDNIIRGQSSFQVEMEEIRSVLHRADANTLLLGDEVCRGTEVQSANAIVYSLFESLCDKGVFFLAATHLHELADHIQKKLPKVRICHTKVEVKSSGDIVYHRVLEDGPGPSLYGLEVARALDFPSDFIKRAAKFRQQSVSPKKSKYNKLKVVSKCQVCGYSPRKGSNDLPLDTHHIKFQCHSDDQGFHDHNHKHALHNLVVLCKQCHAKVHSEEIRLFTEQTPKGQVLSFVHVEPHHLKLLT